MDIVVDTSALLAVVVGEPERDRLVEITTGHDLIGPGAIPWEVGNAFTAMYKQRRIDLEAAVKGCAIFQSIPIRYIEVDFENAISVAFENSLYAYDAYFLDCAMRYAAPLLSLDRKLRRVAESLNISVIEV